MSMEYPCIYFEKDGRCRKFSDDTAVSYCIPGYRERAEKAERERRAVLERLGEFGQLFIDYVGCPRGAMGRQCAPLTEELLSMPVITDVDGGRWRPVNEDALQEAIALLKERQG